MSMTVFTVSKNLALECKKLYNKHALIMWCSQELKGNVVTHNSPRYCNCDES